MKERFIKVLKVAPFLPPKVIVLENNLMALQNAVSIGADYRGLIEVIDLDEKACIICNEEGKMIGLEPNRRLGDDILCGVFYVAGQNKNGNFVSLNDSQITRYSQIFANIDIISPDEVENIVGMIDRRMRDINLKSPRCTKNEAAILCALSYCSERMAMQEAFKKVEKDAFRFSGENEKLKKTIEALQEEVDNLRKDASVMRSILDHAAAANAPAKEEKPKYVPKPFTKKVEEEAPAFEEPATAEKAIATAAPVEEAPVVVEETKSQKSTSKNRVGAMFDFLTFSDV